ncbi:MAG: hypothetical protein ABSG49_05385 [Methanoregula sp.]|jgi:hypothetical protein|uniref:hypothetical protein n=1 Tax=Methanoregula sp. TaxID=2052170 RepID=UPI003C1E32BD
MGILEKVYHFIFGGEDKQENSDFDLKALKENLRKVKEKESEKNPINRRNNEKRQKINEENYEILRVIKWVPDPLNTYARRQKTDEKLLVETLKVRNPLLLGVKMFLAEIPFIIKGYYVLDKNNCFKFSKDVQDAATKRGIRCGVVIIGFHRSPTGHAIVAFETDYGLKFFEPQSANEEDVVIGRRYSAILSEVSEDDIITKVEIFWNDGMHTIMK